MCEPSQKGLLLEAPQRQRVTRFRISYARPSADSMVIRPLTQIGPLTPATGSWTRPIDGSKTGSYGFLVALSQTTSHPEGQ